MRRSLALLLIAFALLGRILAPVAAEARVIDPLADAIICAHDGGTSAPKAPDKDADHRTHALCAQTCCQVASGFVTPVVDVRPITRDAGRFIYRPTTTAVAFTRLASAHRARGPPHS